MAKPIEATPTLRGKDAERFIRLLVKEEKNPSKKRIKMLEEARKIKFNVIN